MSKYQEVRELLKKSMREKQPFIRLYCRNVLNMAENHRKELQVPEVTDEVMEWAIRKQIKVLEKSCKKMGDCALSSEYQAEVIFCKVLLGEEDLHELLVGDNQ